MDGACEALACAGRQQGRVIHQDHICVTLRAHPCPLNPVAPKKTSTLNLRIDPSLKEAAQVAALREHRSVANLVELLIRRHCEATGIPIPEQVDLFEEASGDE